MSTSHFPVPPSTLLKDASREALARWDIRQAGLSLVDLPDDERELLLLHRRHAEQNFYPPLIARYRELYPVEIRPDRIGGIPVERIGSPGVGRSRPERRVVINLHGGGFIGGGQIESIPLAAMSGMEIVSVDYRMAPEHRFPAASEDVAAVYTELLRSISPSRIGIVGCSAGALLAAQSIALFVDRGLPVPAAIAMQFGAGAFWTEGDTGHFRPLFAGAPFEPANEHAYFRHADGGDPLAFPVRAPALLAQFPPALLVSATRDHALSSIVHTHRELFNAGVPADLHVWEGLGHAFYFDPELPESHEVHRLTALFFDHHLAGTDEHLVESDDTSDSEVSHGA